MLTGSSVTDLDFLESYAGLRELNLEGTDVKDIEVLANLKNLTNLSLLDSNVENISPLADLALQELYIDQNVYDNNAITVEKLNVTGCNVFTHTK